MLRHLLLGVIVAQFPILQSDMWKISSYVINPIIDRSAIVSRSLSQNHKYEFSINV